MRGLSLVLVMALGASAAASPSNPAFLGIAFGPTTNNVGARIETVTPSSPAARAGLMPGDMILAIDGSGVDVNTLNRYIVAHEPGDTIKLDIVRGNQYLELTPRLTTRADMFDRLLGHALPAMALEDSESGHAVELAKPSGHATVVAWYHAGGGGSCIDPVPVVQDVARRVSAVKNSGAVVVGATYAGGLTGETYGPITSGPIAADRQRLGLPIFVTNRGEFGNVAIDECGRVFAMVLDCHGIVTFVSPISDGDDEDATLDEIATAAAQADHKRR